MADIASQIDAARKGGYSDDEIITFLGSSHPELAPKIKAAREEGGYGPDEIIKLLSVKPSTTAGTGKTGVRAKGEPRSGGFFGPMVEGEKQLEEGVGKLGTNLSDTIGGASDIFRGALGMAYPYAAALSLSSWPALIGTAAGIPAAGIAQLATGPKGLGFPEGVSHAVGDVTGALAGWGASKLPEVVNPRTMASLAAKIPGVPLPVKLALKAYGMTPPPTSTAGVGDYLQHGQGPEPGNWGLGLGVGPKEGMNPPPDWLKTLQSFKWQDMERKLRNQSQKPQPPTAPPPDLFTTTKGGFGNSRIPRQNVTPTTTIDPSMVPDVPAVEPRPEIQGPAPVTPVVRTPGSDVLPRTTVGGFGTSQIPKRPLVPVESFPEPPAVEPVPVELRPELMGQPITPPAPPPQSVDISGAPREVAEPKPEAPPPVFGSPEWAKQFQEQYPGLPVPQVPKPKITDAQAEAEIAKRTGAQPPAAPATKPLAAPPAAAEPLKEPPPPEPLLLNVSANEMYGSDYTGLNSQAKANLDAFIKANQRVPTLDDVKSGAFNRFGREAKPAAPAPAEEPKVEKPQPKEEPKVEPEPEPKPEPKEQDSWPQRYQDMVEPHGVTGARDTLNKDTKIAKHLLDNKETPASWKALELAKRNQYVKDAHPGGKPLGKGGKRARPVDVITDHIAQRMQELMDEGYKPKELTPPPKETLLPPPDAPKPTAAAAPPAKPTVAAAPGKPDPAHTKVARWLISDRDTTDPEWWDKQSDTLKKAYINLAGAPIAEGDRGFDAQDAGIGRELRRLLK